MPFARTLDPSTSHEAAKSVEHVTDTKKAILYILSVPCSDVELVDRYYALVDAGKAPKASPSGIRSRRAELVEQGLVADTGYRVRLASGRKAILWAVSNV
jgi:hypothetical protein